MTLFATWIFGMGALPTEVLAWPHGVDAAMLVLTIGLLASIAALVFAREDGRSIPSRGRTRIRLEGLHSTDDPIPNAA